jgi:hypothetical protein
MAISPPMVAPPRTLAAAFLNGNRRRTVAPTRVVGVHSTVSAKATDGDGVQAVGADCWAVLVGHGQRPWHNNRIHRSRRSGRFKMVSHLAAAR